MTSSRSVYAWQPQPGPQTALLRCPLPDVFYGGARGGGKTDAMLGEWLQHEAQYGRHARGIVFRRKRTQLIDLKTRGIELFARVGAKYNASEHYFTFRSGAVLRFAYLESDADAEEYQGHSYTRVYIEELPQFPDPAPINKLKATLRSAEGVPCAMRSTGNPGGPGHLWVKAHYIEPHPEGYKVIRDDETGMHRAFIPARVSDNPALLSSDPGYVNRLKASGSPALVRAWLDGDWDAVQGAFLEGVWLPEQHIVEPFTVPISWPRWRAMDWGYAKPYSVGWYAMDYDGVIYRYRELYGYGGKPNTGTRETASVVAGCVVDIEQGETERGTRWQRSPADRATWSKIGAEHSIIENFFDEGVYFVPSDSSPGSRVNGAQEVVERLHDGTFKVFSTCRHFLRTVPVIMADEKNADDVDTEQEDHAWDEVRYSLMSRRRVPSRPPKAARTDPHARTFDEVAGPSKARWSGDPVKDRMARILEAER
ncbi:MAG: terminase large subunit domain-containing protein [Gammaproteobacteria bacterium]